MADKKKKDLIQEIFSCLLKVDLGIIDSFFKENAILIWGPFIFEGKNKIFQWAKEFGEIFKNSTFDKKYVEVHESKGTNIFILRTYFFDGRIGELHCTARYELENGKIKLLETSLNHGYILVAMEVAKRLGIRKP